MEVVITEWALQSYFDLNHVFTHEEYRQKLRPDVELLASYPSHPQFHNHKFWGPCKEKSSKFIPQGFKMKWHNIGHGRVQLRLFVVIAHSRAYLCNAYVKENENLDFREMFKLKTKIQLINEGRVVSRGRLL